MFVDLKVVSASIDHKAAAAQASYRSLVASRTVRTAAWLKSTRGTFFFLACFLAREASALSDS
jgi:hypothetical protein